MQAVALGVGGMREGPMGGRRSLLDLSLEAHRPLAVRTDLRLRLDCANERYAAATIVLAPQ